MSLAPKKSLRPKRNPMNDINSPQSVEGRSTREMKKGGKVISEYGGKEKYSSKAAMAKHEKAESPKMERAEKKMAGGGMCGTKKMATGGVVRGTGAAKRGTGFGKNG